MSENVGKQQEAEINNVITSIMGFTMGALAIGGIWFVINFIWEFVKMMG